VLPGRKLRKKKSVGNLTEGKEKGRCCMKKLVLALVLAMAVPAMAAVNFSAADAGGGVLAISYDTTDGDLPRGIALKVEVTDGVVQIAGAADAAASAIEAGFNTFIDYAYSNPVDFAIGDGHPYAKVGEPGALEADAAAAVITMGVLDEDGDETKGEAGPASAAPLVNVLLGGAPGTTVSVTISADTMRGPDSGVVGSILASNLPITIDVQIPGGGGCVDTLSQAGYENQLAAYNAYIAAGKTAEDLACWCTAYQCDGDVDGATETILNYRVYNADIAAIVANWKAKVATADPCADIDHATETILKYAVYNADIAKVVANWKAKDTALAGDCPRKDGM